MLHLPCGVMHYNREAFASFLDFACFNHLVTNTFCLVSGPGHPGYTTALFFCGPVEGAAVGVLSSGGQGGFLGCLVLLV